MSEKFVSIHHHNISGSKIDLEKTFQNAEQKEVIQRLTCLVIYLF